MKRTNTFFSRSGGYSRSFGQPKAKNIIFMTDSWTHNDDDTIFPMALHLSRGTHQGPFNVYIIDRAATKNAYFFDSPDAALEIYGFKVEGHYDYDSAVHYCVNQRMLTTLKPKDIDIAFMMMDQPVEDSFLKSLTRAFPRATFMNHPLHACHLGNKAYLDTLYRLPQLRGLMPRTALCHSAADIEEFARASGGRIVLKTLKGYGGTGVKRYGHASADADIKTAEELNEFLYKEDGACIAMERLDHPQQEDNRLLVVNGQIVGALRRTPAEGAFLCNMCAGGSADIAIPEDDEIELIRALAPILEQHELRFVGIDTLRHIDPETGQSRRLLSEINTLNTGGLSFINELTGRRVLEAATEMLITDILDDRASRDAETPKLSSEYMLFSSESAV